MTPALRLAGFVCVRRRLRHRGSAWLGGCSITTRRQPLLPTRAAIDYIEAGAAVNTRAARSDSEWAPTSSRCAVPAGAGRVARAVAATRPGVSSDLVSDLSRTALRETSIPAGLMNLAPYIVRRPACPAGGLFLDLILRRTDREPGAQAADMSAACCSRQRSSPPTTSGGHDAWSSDHVDRCSSVRA